MALSAVKLPAPSLDPTRCDGTELPVELLLMAKVMVVAWLVTGQISILPAPYLPFLPALDHLPPQAFRVVLLLTASLASIALLFNLRVRACCLLIGGSILVGTLASRPFFANNRLFFACLMVLIGLYEPGRRPLLVRLQVVLLYLGAGLDKLLDADWRSGRFFDLFARRLSASGDMWSPGWGAGGHNELVELYLSLSARLPAMLLARIVSSAVIAAELGLAMALLLRPSAWAIRAHVLLQSAILLFTGSPLGMFFYAAVSASLAFVELPSHGLRSNPRTWLILALLLSGPWFRSWMVLPPLLFILWPCPPIRTSPRSP